MLLKALEAVARVNLDPTRHPRARGNQVGVALSTGW
jgi:hypothetical protein